MPPGMPPSSSSRSGPLAGSLSPLPLEPSQGDLLLEQARAGQLEAIVALINRALAPRGIQVRGELWPGGLTLWAVGQAGPPDRTFLAAFVQRGMAGLAAPMIASVVVQGFGPEDQQPVWQERLEIVPWVADGPRRVDRYQLRRSAAHAMPRTQHGRRDWSDHLGRARQRYGPLIGGGLGLLASVALAALARWVLVWLAETQIYETPYAGPLLRAIDAIDILNLFVFAVLGAGAGLAATLWPRPAGLRWAALLATVALPLLLAIGPAVREWAWVQRVAQVQNLPRPTAQVALDRFLGDRVGETGVWGTYLYSARYAELPVTAAAMKEAPAIDQQIEATLASLTRSQPRQVAWWLEAASWGLRLFYAAMAAVATASHFDRGLRFGRRWQDG